MKFKEALELYNKAKPMEDAHLDVLQTHFKKLEALVLENPELVGIRPYVFNNLYRIENIICARKEK